MKWILPIASILSVPSVVYCAGDSLADAARSAKARAVMAIAADSAGWIRQDIAWGQTNRAARIAGELSELVRHESARQARVASGEEADFPRIGGDFSFGFGHFEQVVDEMEHLVPLGHDIIQVEFGPEHVFPAEGVINTNGIERFVRAADKADRLGMKVCLLISPHLFPKWAIEKEPELEGCVDGMFRYCVHHPSARALLKRYLEVVLPHVCGRTSLHSICLSNEPVMSYWGKKCVLRPRFAEWLRSRYGDIASLNAKWGTGYSDFGDVQMPEHCYLLEPSPESLEIVRFNREAFAEFHAWLARTVEELAPGVPLHSKVMIHQNFKRNTSFFCVDPELFDSWSGYSGCDCSDYVTPDDPVWAHDFALMEAGYDYLRSVSRKPVFNSENHIIEDFEKRDIPPGHVYSSLWQNMIHGQESTAIWFWERARTTKGMAWGLFLDRPTCLAATAFAALDANRLCREIKAIAARRPTILLHWSLSSLVLDKRDGSEFLCVYRAASCLGQPLGFATEKVLSDYAAGGGRLGALEDVRAVVLPDSSHLPDSVRAGLARLAAEGVPVVCCGRRPALSDFNEQRDGDQFPHIGDIEEGAIAKTLWTLSNGWNLPDYPHVSLPDGSAPFGVESNGVVLDGARVVSVVNHTKRPVLVRFPGQGLDMISGRQVSLEMELQPLSPVLVKLDCRDRKD